MKTINKLITGTIVSAVVGGGILLGAGAASAATAPPWEPDANAIGTLSFYNASGAQITGGNDLSHLFDYALASTTAARTNTTKATVFFGYPDHTKADTTQWISEGASAAATFPDTSAPAPLNAAGRRPLAHPSASDVNLTAKLGGATLDQTAGYKDIVQIRVKDSGAGIGNGFQTQFWAADISFDQTAGTWKQVFPAVATATTTALAASPNPSTVGDTVTLTATEAPAAAGSVQFSDGGTALGAPVDVNSSGVATKTVSTLTAGSHALTAVFTPTDTSAFGASTGSLSATVNPAATPTTTALALSGGYATAGSAATLTANVTGPGTTPNGAGTVAFYDNGATSAIPGTVATPSTGTYVLDLPAGFAAGAHSIVAKFTPTSTANFQVSQSAAQAFSTQPAQGTPCADPASQCTDPQPIQATVPAGTLVISTPYTSASPLDLGTLALSADSTKYTGSKPFQNIVVTDARAGNLPWTAKALSSPLTDGKSNANSVVNAQNVGLTGLVATKSSGYTGTVTTSDNPAANAVGPTATGSLGLGGTAPHTIATSDKGLGSVTMNGLLTLNVPSSTEPGLFSGTITFTVG